MNKLGVAALVVGCAVLAGLALWSGVANAGRDVLRAAWVLPAMIAVHLVQLFLSALSWRALLGRDELGREKLGRDELGPAAVWRMRWIREGIDSLLPVAQVGGELVTIRLLALRAGRPAHAAAATILDLLVEAVTLPVMVVVASVVLWWLGGDLAVLRWVWIGAGLLLVGIFVLWVAHRMGWIGVAERLWARLAPASLRVDGLQDAIAALLHRRAALAAAVAWHLCAWSLGAAEVWLALWAVGHPIGAAAAFVVEAFGGLARGAGFAIPASLGVQDGGYVLAAGLFGVAPDAALAMAALKRLREVLVGVAGLALWHIEARRGGRRVPPTGTVG